MPYVYKRSARTTTRPRTVYKRSGYAATRRPVYQSRKAYKGRKTYKRKYYRHHPGSRLDQGTVYAYKRTIDLGNIVSSNAGVVNDGMSFMLNQLPDYTDFTALYDEYKITGIKIQFIPQQSDDEATAATTTAILHTAIDYDDDTTPATVNDLLQYQNHRMTKFNQEFKTYFAPKVAEDVFVSTTPFVGFNPARAWIDVQYPDCPHYGFKYVIHQTSVVTGWRAFVTYYVKFRAVDN